MANDSDQVGDSGKGSTELTSRVTSSGDSKVTQRRGGLPTDTVVVFSLPSKKVFRWFALVVLLVAVVPAGYLGKKMHHQWIKQRASTLVNSRLGALAAEVLDPWREDFVSNVEDCKMILTAYELAYRIDRLQWAVESCTEHKINSVDVYIAYGEVYEAHGEINEAQEAYEAGARNFKNVRAWMMLVNVLKARGQPQEAAHSLEDAMKNLERSNLILNLAIETNLELKYWNRAGEIAAGAPELLEARNIPNATRNYYEAIGRSGRTAALPDPTLKNGASSAVPMASASQIGGGPNTSNGKTLSNPQSGGGFGTLSEEFLSARNRPYGHWEPLVKPAQPQSQPQPKLK